MLLLALIPVFMGSGLAIQTAINSRLGSVSGSSFLASMVSFVVGAIFLNILLILTGTSPLVNMTTITSNPWWIWLGGVLGVVGLTTNILLFPKLGSVQTAVLPIFGQIVMGQIIDQFGLFESPISKFTFIKMVGLLLVAGGMLLATGAFMPKDKMAKKQHHLLPYQLLGIFAGVLMATQTAINGHLGVILKSSLHAAMISFTVGAVLLIIIVLILPVQVSNLKIAYQDFSKQWWLWIGGFLGAIYVLGCAWLVPQIGTGQVIVLVLFGQLFFSAIIDNWGLLHSKVNPINLMRILGLITMFIGVVVLHFI